jgi:putative oxidoreductase
MTTAARPLAPRPARAVLAAPLRALVATEAGAGVLIARVALGLLLFPHGAQHALGWFGGYGFAGTLGWMTGTLGFPAPLAALAIATELLAPFALAVGLLGRVAALGLGGLMLGAISTHVANGFFMNWFGALPAGAEGFEYHLVVLALVGVVVIAGSGAHSVDGWLHRRLAATSTAPRAARVAYPPHAA